MVDGIDGGEEELFLQVQEQQEVLFSLVDFDGSVFGDDAGRGGRG